MNDENSNFTSEVVEEFDEAGKHTIGHEIYVDRMTGIYRCFDWSPVSRRYVAMGCPSGEESDEAPGEVRKLDKAEVMMQLANARQAAQAENTAAEFAQKNKVADSSQSRSVVVGLVLPAALRPGQRVSGSIVLDPERYAGYPSLRIDRITLPEPFAGESRLSQWTIEVEGGPPQTADGAISFTVPAAANIVHLTLRRVGDSSIVQSQTLEFTPAPAQKSVATMFQTAALCFKRNICQMAGPFSGDSHNTFAAFDSAPARALAQNQAATFVQVPEFTSSGPATLIVAEGNRVIAAMIVVADVNLTPASGPVEAGRDLAIALRVSGVADLSPQQWRYGIFPADDLERARAIFPGISPAKAIEKDRERREKQEKQDGLDKKKEDEKWEESAGMVLVVVRNTTPDIGTLRGVMQPVLSFRLGPESFSRGDFAYNMNIDSVASGTAIMQATAIPFLAPVKAEVFDTTTAQK